MHPCLIKKEYKLIILSYRPQILNSIYVYDKTFHTKVFQAGQEDVVLQLKASPLHHLLGCSSAGRALLSEMGWTVEQRLSQRCL